MNGGTELEDEAGERQDDVTDSQDPEDQSRQFLQRAVTREACRSLNLGRADALASGNHFRLFKY
jgi:hypothetical protein